MDRLTAELLYQHIKGISSELHEIPAEQVKAYILITATTDGRVLLSTNITSEIRLRRLIAAQALDPRPMVPQVPDGLF